MESHKLIFTGRIADTFQEMVTLCIILRKDEEAFLYTEKSKSRAFVELLSETDVGYSHKMAKELKVQENRCLKQLKQTRKRSMNEYSFLQISAALKEILSKLEIIYEKIDKIDPEYAAMRKGKPLDFEELKACLK